MLMTLWCIARSPVMHGGDRTKTDVFALELLANDEVLAVARHSENNRQLCRADEGFVAWIADVPGSKDKCLAVFNTTDEDAKGTVEMASIGFKEHPHTFATCGSMRTSS